MENRKLRKWQKRRKRDNAIRKQHNFNARNRPKDTQLSDISPETLGWMARLMMMVRGEKGV